MPGLTEDLKLLVDARDQRVIERTRVTNRLHAQLVVLAPGYTREIPELTTPGHLAAIERLLRHLAGVRAELARAELSRLQEPQSRTYGKPFQFLRALLSADDADGSPEPLQNTISPSCLLCRPGGFDAERLRDHQLRRGHKTDRHDRGSVMTGRCSPCSWMVRAGSR